MAEQNIEFRKIRDFGQNLNDTFLFLRQNLKPLFKAFFAICGIFMLGEAIFNGIYQSHSFGFLDQLIKGNKGGGYAGRTIGQLINFEYLMMLICMLLAFVSMKVVLGAYIKYYVEHNGQQPGIEDIWVIFKKYFLKIFLYSIPIALLTVFGFLLCIFPGIYLWVVWVPFTLVVMIEDTNFNGAMYRCFEIIKENFWNSFAIYLVAYIIYSISSSIIGVMVGVIVGLAAYFTTDSLGKTMGIVTSFLNVFSFAFYIIYFISAAFQYFTLVEQRDGTGILSRIDSIGRENNNFDNIEEQY